MKIALLLLYCLILGYACHPKISVDSSPTSNKTRYINKEKSFLLCMDCKQLAAVEEFDYPKIKEIGIYDRRCKVNPLILKFSNLQELVFMSDKIKFPKLDSGLTSLRVLNIYDNIWKEMPDFIFLHENLERLTLFLENESFLDKVIGDEKAKVFNFGIFRN